VFHFERYSFLEILTEAVRFVLLICFVYSTCTTVPTVCDVLTVGNIVTIIVHFAIEHQVYHDWKFKEQHAKNPGKYCGGKKILSPPWFQHCGGKRPVAPAIPTPL